MIPEQIPPESERDPNQAWFWTDEWLAGERETDEETEPENVKIYATSEEFMRSLF